MFGRDPVSEAAETAYGTIVRQAREPALYQRYGVADTLDGRFDLLVLHAALVMIRLRGEGGDSDRFAQALFDTLFVDMDQSLREIGVSDVSIGKKVKQMGRAFYGRLEAYDSALHALEGDRREQELAEALLRNLYRQEEQGDLPAVETAAYVIRQAEHLAGLPSSEIVSGRVSFAAP